MNTAQARSLQQIAKAIIASCETFAPGGAIYAALMAQGCSLNQYQSIMSGLTGAGMLTQSGDCYTATDKGRTFAAM